MPEIADENWNLSPKQHFDRAEDLMRIEPKAGDVIETHMQRTVIAGRHCVFGLIKMGRERLGDDAA